jgi:hypothetical protein
MGELSIIDYIIYTLLPFGQLFARIINFNGSLSLWGLLLFPPFYFPIVGILPLLIMQIFGMKDGNVKTSIVDKYLFLPIIIKFYSSYIQKTLNLNNSIEYNITTFILQIIVGIISNIARRNNMCTPPATFNSYFKAFMDATISHNMGEFIAFILPFIPIINNTCNNPDSSIQHSLFWSFGFGITYLINNMYNEYDVDRYCSLPFLGHGQDMFLFMGSIFILILTKYNSLFNYVPQNNSANLF